MTSCAHLGPIRRWEEEEPGEVLTIVVTLLDFLRCPIYQHIQGPHHTGDSDDVECDRAEYLPPFTRGHLELFPLQTERNNSLIAAFTTRAFCLHFAFQTGIDSANILLSILYDTDTFKEGAAFEEI